MPWKESRSVDLKIEFVTRLQRGERMSDLCREYGIHRQTGYEVWARYHQSGLDGLQPRSRAPKHIPHKCSSEVAQFVVEERKRHPTWGPKKLKHLIERERGLRLPSASTIGEILKREGLVVGRKRRRFPALEPTGLRSADEPNQVWGADYKGQFRLGDRSYCYPLTISDLHSRLLVACDGMAAIDEDAALEAFENAFRAYGLPETIRTDNGVPFVTTGLCGLSRLSVFWLRLGIGLERIARGKPQQNGRHERMHRTLKRDTARPASRNLLQQQERFDCFRQEFNTVRPHEALEQKRPADVHRLSTRTYPDAIPEPDYPLDDDILNVTTQGHLVFGRGHRYYLSKALGGQQIGLTETDSGAWQLRFMHLELGIIDPQTRTFEPSNAPSRG